MVKVSAACRPLYRSTLDRCFGRPIDRHSANISVDMSTDISRSIYRPSVGRYVDWHIGRVSVDISADTSVDRVSVDMSTDISVEGCTKYTWSKFPVDFDPVASTRPGGIWKRGFLWKCIKCFPSTLRRRNLKTQQKPVIFFSGGWRSWCHSFRKAPFSNLPVPRKTESRRFQIPSDFEKRFRRAPFSWRISVDGKPSRRKKAVAFSNSSGVVWTRSCNTCFVALVTLLAKKFRVWLKRTQGKLGGNKNTLSYNDYFLLVSVQFPLDYFQYVAPKSCWKL